MSAALAAKNTPKINDAMIGGYISCFLKTVYAQKKKIPLAIYGIILSFLDRRKMESIKPTALSNKTLSNGKKTKLNVAIKIVCNFALAENPEK